MNIKLFNEEKNINIIHSINNSNTNTINIISFEYHINVKTFYKSIKFIFL